MTTSHSDLTEKVAAILKDKRVRSGGHCGTYPVSIQTQLGVNYSTLRAVLNTLYTSKLISVHEGPHGKLIKWKGKI